MSPAECAAQMEAAGVEESAREAALARVIVEVLDSTSNVETAAELLGVAYVGIGRATVRVFVIDESRVGIDDTGDGGLYGELKWEDDGWFVSEPEGSAFEDMAFVGGVR